MCKIKYKETVKRTSTRIYNNINDNVESTVFVILICTFMNVVTTIIDECSNCCSSLIHFSKHLLVMHSYPHDNSIKKKTFRRQNIQLNNDL